ncbi:hypothetical protein H5410_008246 [Solanum commersonii]|uniref:LRAT domain-containing protein n=1 Tax=Solanum commersonii TaxID=4109 RepID=A0A9J6AFH5_SOLCO|nr:hypothetical protein H5410_008246 [Solanum commersonii]
MSESSRWTMPELAGILSNKIPQDELKPGDHIYSWRNAYLYAHHGIYFGDGMVIHFTRAAGQEIGTGTVLDRFIFSSSPSHPSGSPCPRCGDQSRTEGVISSCLECFLCGGELYLFKTVLEFTTYSRTTVRISIYCKTGLLVFTNVSVGGWADNILLAATTAIVSSPLRFLTTGVSGLAAVGFGVYCVSRYVSDIGVRAWRP